MAILLNVCFVMQWNLRRSPHLLEQVWANYGAGGHTPSIRCCSGPVCHVLEPSVAHQLKSLPNPVLQNTTSVEKWK